MVTDPAGARSISAPQWFSANCFALTPRMKRRILLQPLLAGYACWDIVSWELFLA
jgi:hypothetical protein